MNDLVEVGSRIRSTRQQRELSLNEVAARAGISVATLSRIETSKQSVGVDVLLALARILSVPPADLLGSRDQTDDTDSLVDRLAALRATDRAEVLRAASRSRRQKDLAAVVDDLLSTLDIVREELEQFAKAARGRRR